MLQSVIFHELHGLLYITCALLIYLILTPIYVHKEHKRKLLFVFILLVLTYFYLNYEDIDPLIYSLHLIPVSLSLAVMFIGLIPGICTWMAFNFGSYLVLHNEFWPVFLSSTLLLCSSLWYKTRTEGRSSLYKMLFAVITMTLYLGAFFTCNPLPLKAQFEASLYILIGSYLSTCLVTYLFFHVKRHEINKEKLFLSEKERMIGQLAATVSHEIRNPLTTTRGFLQMMQQRQSSEEERQKYLALAISGLDEANSIISDYLYIAKPYARKDCRFDICEELAAIVRFIYPLAVDSKIELVVEHSSSSPLYIVGEPKKLRQCMMNLIKNAIESMPQGGTVTISTHCTSHKVHITITDTGIGMTKAQIKSLGIPYYTTKEQGTGLGLVVVMDLIKGMNGTISFSSHVGKGTSCQLLFRNGSAQPEGLHLTSP